MDFWRLREKNVNPKKRLFIWVKIWYNRNRLCWFYWTHSYLEMIARKEKKHEKKNGNIRYGYCIGSNDNCMWQ